MNNINASIDSSNKPDIIKVMTNKVFDLIIQEISKDDMKEVIKTKVIHPLLYILYCQLYPYIFTFIIIVMLMLLILIVLLIGFILYLRR